MRSCISSPPSLSQAVVQLGESPERVFLSATWHRCISSSAARRAATGERLRAAPGGEKPVGHVSSGHARWRGQRRADAELLAALICAAHAADIHHAQRRHARPRAVADGRAVHGRPRQCACVRVARQLRYLSLLRQVDGVVGNSSSVSLRRQRCGSEPSNIGDRQRGRLKAASVIDCEPDRAAIGAALARLYSPAFKTGLAAVRNPYGEAARASRSCCARSQALDGS